MTSGSLQSTYERYKADTNSVAAWLASTAKACGFKFQRESANGGIVPSKKQAKKLVTETHKQIIAVRDFVPLANFIAAFNNPPVRVPHSFTKTLDRVIALRLQHGNQKRQFEGTVDAISDAKHLYFVGVLQQVQDALKSCPVLPRKNDTSKPNHTTGMPSIANAFAALELHEPSQEFSQTPDLERPHARPADNARYEVELLKTPEELLMIYRMVIDDLGELRSAVRQAWTRYGKREYDLVAVAVATNTAIEFARNLTKGEDDLFKSSISDVETKSTLAWSLHVELCKADGLEADDSTEQFPFNPGTYYLAERSFFVPYCVLRDLVGDFSNQENHLRLLKLEGMHGLPGPSPTDERQHMSGGEKYAQDHRLIREFFNTRILSSQANNYPVEDEFIRGLKERQDTGDMPFYLIFAAQVYLEIHHSLGGEQAMSRGFGTMLQQMNMMRSEIRGFLKYREGGEAISADLIRELEVLKADIETITEGDNFLIHRQAMGAPLPPSMIPHRMLKRSPLLAGLTLYYFRVRMNAAGIRAAQLTWSITTAAHLFNHLNRTGYIPGLWLDMESTTFLTGDSVWRAGRPKGQDDYYKAFILQVGVKGSELKGREEPRKPGPDRVLAMRKAKVITDNIPIYSMFKNRYLENRVSMEWTAEEITEVVAHSAFHLDVAEADKPYDAFVRKGKHVMKESKKQGKRKADQDASVTVPASLFFMLLRELQMETLALAWPFLVMHQHCVRFLRNVQISCTEAVGEEYMSKMFGLTMDDLPTIASILMQDSTDDELKMAAAEVGSEFFGTKKGRVIGKMLEMRTGFMMKYRGTDEKDEKDAKVLFELRRT